MRKAVAQFLRHLRSERDASEHTLKSYREDLLALADYLEDDDGRSPSNAHWTPVQDRGDTAVKRGQRLSCGMGWLFA